VPTVNIFLAATGEGGETPSILLPASYDLIWGGVSFLILLAMFSKFVLPRLNTVMAERSERIEGGIARAERLQAEANATLEQYQQALAAAREEAASIRAQAQTDRTAIIEQARSEAAAAAATVTARAMEQMEAQRAAALASLRRDVGSLALDLASRVVGEALADDDRARATVDRFLIELDRVGADGGTPVEAGR
jgi:F-type H+-transporting ATPase subunit b